MLNHADLGQAFVNHWGNWGSAKDKSKTTTLDDGRGFSIPFHKNTHTHTPNIRGLLPFVASVKPLATHATRLFDHTLIRPTGLCATYSASAAPSFAPLVPAMTSALPTSSNSHSLPPQTAIHLSPFPHRPPSFNRVHLTSHSSFMAPPYPPPHGGHVHAPTSDVSYSAYSPSPSSMDAIHHRYNRINQWTKEVPQPPGRPGAETPGKSVGAGSATWSDELGTVDEEGSPSLPRPQQGGFLQPPRANGQSHPQPPHSPSPSHRARGPPVPLLAQTPQYDPTPELSRGQNLARSPSFHPKHPTTVRSARSAREAYLNSALELPLDMLREVAAPNEVFDVDYSPRPSRMGTILNRARSTVSLKGAASASPQHPHPAPGPMPSTPGRPRVTSHSQSRTYSRRQSQKSLRSVPEMHIFPKLVVNARPPHAGLGPEVRPVAAQSPTHSYEDSKCSSLQTSSEEYAIVKADPAASAQPTIVSLHVDELNVTSKGVTAKGVGVHAAPVLAPLLLPANQGVLPPSELSRRTTSRGHHTATAAAPAMVTDGRVEQLSTAADSHPPNSYSRTERRPPLLKSASVDGHMHSAVRALPRAPSSASERTVSDQGVVFTPSSGRVDNVRDNGDHITFAVPSNRRGNLHISLAWLPGRSRGTQSQPDPSRPNPAAVLAANAVADRRASLQAAPPAAMGVSRRRSFSASGPAPPMTLPPHQSSALPSQVMPGAPPVMGPHPGSFIGVPLAPSIQQHLPPGAMPFQAGAVPPGVYSPQASGPRPHSKQMPGSLPPGMPPALPQPNGLPQGAQLGGMPLPGPGYPIQPAYYPIMQAPMQIRPGMPMGLHQAYPGQPMQPRPPMQQPATAGRPAPAAQRAHNIGHGAPPVRPVPTRAATLPNPSTSPRWLKMWPFNKNLRNDAFVNRPAAGGAKFTQFAEPVVTKKQTQKDLDRERRAQRRDERERRRSGAEMGVNVKAQGK